MVSPGGALLLVQSLIKTMKMEVSQEDEKAIKSLSGSLKLRLFSFLPQ
jgi:hypothetical protein